MPATVFVRFDAPGPVEATPRRLHAAWGRVLDLPEGISPERAARLPALAHRPLHDQPGPKPYCLGDMTQTPEGLGVELRFLDDRLLDTLDAWLAWGGVLPVGDGSETTAVLAAVEAQVLEQADWEDLAANDTATAWDIRLLTPTVFTSRGQHVPDVTAASLATSLHSRWYHWCRHLAPVLPERERLASVLVTQDRTRRTVVGLGMPRADRRGRLSSHRIHASIGALRISAPSASATTAVFSQLMALARYTNVGSHGAYGMGVIDVVADAP
ncbi:CRISPR system precrRNA processing endoribonuclease RAMP protein Cas6 [Actinomyces sp. ZJ308]|uniref:CRISPR system precrRNA processing endoribonuclease RAMP protein Cas6 n=1 Tax=Actinomyces sp. ZJ308 TaxID=2708342 RepID=UPI001423FF91|nr:CRISPR system precrRNA processing endoribonuclease RAMP protein Cas6 [Actinomyces sp. ZJ308]